MLRIFKQITSITHKPHNSEDYTPNYNIREIISYVEDGNIDLLRNALTPLNPYDKSDILNTISNDDFASLIVKIYDILESETFLNLTETKKRILINKIGYKEITSALLRLENDDVVGFIDDLDTVEQDAILSEIPRSTRKNIKLSLTYDKDQVGRFIDTDFLSFSKDVSVYDIKQKLEQIGDDLSENTRDVFIFDDEENLIGMVNLFSLLTNDPEKSALSILDDDFKVVHDTDDKSEIVFMFNKYGIRSLPVLDKQNKMVGFISSDIAIDIINSESQEDILRLGGVSENYEDFSIKQKTYTRFIWLFFNLNAALISSSVIGSFSDTITAHSYVAVFLPVVASIGGNCGMQTTTLVIRMIGMKAINEVNQFSVAVKEFIISCINAMVFLFVGFVFAFLISKSSTIAYLFATAITINILISSIIGFCIPMLIKKLRFDPAVASSILLTTLTDTIGFAVFLSLVHFFLR